MTQEEAGLKKQRLLGILPPGGQVAIDVGTSTASLPFWRYWLTIAEAECDRSIRLAITDEQIDTMSRAMANAQAGLPASPVPESPDSDDVQSMYAAMVAVAASAHAVDGFYGTVRKYILTAPTSERRHSQILETLKYGFHVGKYATAWAVDLKWLFKTRDNVVHSGEVHKTLVVTRVTSETAVFGAEEAYQVTSESARRAAKIAREVMEVCIANPKKSTKQWADSQGVLA